MLVIDKKSTKRWSRVGQRATFGLIMVQLMEALRQENRDDDIMVLTADVSTSAGLERFRSMFPEQYLDVGISEQNMMGVAAGLSNLGFCVFTTTFAPFQTMRCLEQIRVDLAYMTAPVKMVGLASGLYHIYLGNTHCCIEDIGVLRSIPNMTLLSPADGAEVAKCIEASLEIEGPVYIRLSGGAPMDVVYPEDYEFEVGRGILLQEGEDLVIFATGTMVKRALAVAEILEKDKGVFATVVDIHTIKPIDRELIEKYKDSTLVVTMEEHNVTGGLGSAVAEVLGGIRHRSKQLFFGVRDFYPHETDYENVMRQCGLAVPDMVAEITENMN